MCQTTKHATATKTHEEFIAEIAETAIRRLQPDEQKLCKLRLVYGVGRSGIRGQTFYGKWKNGEPKPIDLVEICALHEESLVQVAGTTVHEVGHVLANGEGHSRVWKKACGRLGLRHAMQGGQNYLLSSFEPDLREIVARYAFAEGKPAFSAIVAAPVRPCSLGTGRLGGTSRGAGSGSRYRKYTCGCDPAVIVRTARDDLHATCDDCGESFEQA